MVPLLPIERFRSGQIIFNEGEASGSVYVMIHGSVEILRKQGDTLRRIALLGEDDVFGDMALISDAPRSATARAVSNSSCYVIRREDYQKQLQEASPMVQALLKILSSRLRQMNDNATPAND